MYEVLEETDTTRDVNFCFVCDKHLLTIVLITRTLMLHDYMNDQMARCMLLNKARDIPTPNTATCTN